MSRRGKIAVLVAYGLLMLWLLFVQRLGQESEGILQFYPFQTLKRFFWVLANSPDGDLRRNAWINLVGNVAMFVPLGFLIPWIWEFWRKFWRQLLLMAALILAAEICQYVLALGTCDVDDLLLNLLGTTFGYLLWKLIPATP